MNRGSTPFICAARRKSDSADATIKLVGTEILGASPIHSHVPHDGGEEGSLP